MDDNSLQERQEDELKVIEAIYMQDVEDLRSADAWKVETANSVFQPTINHCFLFPISNLSCKLVIL